MASSIGAIERLLNALLEESTAARELLATMHGKSLGLSLVGPEIELVVRAHEQALGLEAGAAGEATAVLRGTPLAMLALLFARRGSQLERSGVSFSGDAETLEAFAQLIELIRPDLEDELARLTGDVIAHETFRVARSASAWARRALDALAMNTAEYLQEESRDLPSRHEAEGFFRDVEQVRDRLERALARARHLGLEPADGEDRSCAGSA